MKEIAVIIPAYRSQFLHRTLSSLSLQKDKNFAVYVCDDASPEDLASIVSDFEDALDIRYKRFDENYGIERQSDHLERCLAQTKEEPLVCFLSDHNEFTPDVIKRVRKVAGRFKDQDVFHLNVQEGLRFCRWIRPEPLFKRIFVKDAPAPLSSFFFRREALGKALFQIRGIQRLPLTLVFACIGPQGRLLTIRRARLLRRPLSADYGSNPATMFGKAVQTLSFFGWTEYFFEGNYPLKPKERVELFASYAARMYPTRTEAEILEKFLTLRVFEREFSKNRGKRILHRSLSK